MKLALSILLLSAIGCGGDDSPPADGGVDAVSDAASDAMADSASDGAMADSGPADTGVACPPSPDASPPAAPDPGPRRIGPPNNCGSPVFLAGMGLLRKPYLQMMTTTSVRIAWTGSFGGDAFVRVRPNSSVPWTEVDAVAETFDRARTGGAADYTAYYADVEGLIASEGYCYQVVESGRVLAAGLRFDTAWTDTMRPVRFLAFGDSGDGSAEQLALRDEMLAHEYDVFLHLGDMAYDDGTFTEFEANFFEPYADLLHRVPTFPTMGNHEYNTDSGQPYLDVFHVWRQALREADQERYYSFDVGNMHFVSLNTNIEMLLPIALDVRGTVTDDMLDWLADDLASSDAEWKVALFHHPPYSSSERSPNTVVRAQILPLLEAGGIDFVLSGHDHHYERSVPILGGCDAAADLGAITYIVAGAGGRGLRAVDSQWWTAAVDNTVYSFVRFTVHGCQLLGETIDQDGNVIDTFELNGCD